jgi:hypothetical protein
MVKCLQNKKNVLLIQFIDRWNLKENRQKTDGASFGIFLRQNSSQTILIYPNLPMHFQLKVK